MLVIEFICITGYDGSTSTFVVLIFSESGVNSGFASYSGGFNFGGNLTSLIVEIGGRDINLAVGPMFDDVTVNVLYNVINTIVTQNITTIETFVSLNLGGDDITIDIAEDIFEHNDVVDVGGVIVIEPIEGPSDATYTELNWMHQLLKRLRLTWTQNSEGEQVLTYNQTPSYLAKKPTSAANRNQHRKPKKSLKSKSPPKK